MIVRTPLAIAAAIAIAAVAALSGCSAEQPTPQPTATTDPVDHTLQATVDGEWILTREVTSTDDANNPDRAVGEKSTRRVLFSNVVCSDGPCTGAVLSGATSTVRATTTLASSANTITYDFSGFLNCVDAATGTVILANGYSYTSHVVLTVKALDKNDESVATTLEGTMTYTDTVTDEAIALGCTRDPIATTTEYLLSAVRATAEDDADEADSGGASVDTTSGSSGNGFGDDAGDD
jgi:hypothetical protein